MKFLGWKSFKMKKIDLAIDTSSDEAIHESFKRIANELLNKYLLELKHYNTTIQYRITNIEFYYYHPKNILIAIHI